MTACDVVITAGQSNAVGRGDSTLSPAVATGDAYEWRSGAAVDLADPVGQPGTFYAANTGSMWPAFANALTAATGRPLIVIPTAVGGTALLEASATASGWWPTGVRYTTSISRATTALTELATAGWVPSSVSVCWHQGESDAQWYPTPATLQADYAAALRALRDDYVADLGIPDLGFYLWRVGDWPSYPDEMASVRAAQDSVAADSGSGVVKVYDRCADFPALGWMKTDSLHYTQAGLNDMGALAGLVVAADLGFTVDPPPPVPAGFAHRRNAADLYALA